MWTPRLLIVTVLVVPAVLLGEPGALDVDCEPTPAEREDLEFLAEQEGIDLDVAIARYGWQECFSEIATSLSERHPNDYAGAAIVDHDRAWIAFRREVPAEARDLAAEVPAEVELIGDRGFSEAELDEALQTIYGQVAAHPDVAASSGGYDVETGHITILAQPMDEIADRDGRERLRAELQPEPPDNETITIELRLVDVIGASDDEAAAWTNAAQNPWLWLLTGLLAAAAVGWLVRGRRTGAKDRPAGQLSSTSDGRP